MKKQLILGVLCVLASLKGISQFQKNDKIVALTIAPYPTTLNNQNDFGFIIKADAEFFITSKVSFVTTGFYSNNTAFTNASGVVLNGYGIIPSLQYYVINKQRWSVHILGGYGLGFTDRTIRSAQNSAISILSLGAGTSYKITERLGVKLQIPYFNVRNISFDRIEVEGAAPFMGLSYNF